MPVDKQSKTSDASIASAETSKMSKVSTEGAFEPLRCAGTLLRGQRSGALATLDEDGAPFASLVNVATTVEGIPIILISRLARHTRNLTSDSRVSLLLSRPMSPYLKEDPTAEPRMSISAHAAISTAPHDRARFLARHPDAAMYADFPDFEFYRLTPTHYHLVAGFGRIHSLTPDQMLSNSAVAAALAEIEQEAIAHLNEEHQDTLTLYATVLAGGHTGDWSAAGIDPEGVDLISGDAIARIWFDRPLQRASELRTALKTMANLARSKVQNTDWHASDA